MAVSQAKRLRSSAQSRAPQPAPTPSPKPNKNPAQHKKHRRRRKLPLLPPPVITRRGKTIIRRYSGRSVQHMEEVKSKIVDCVEFYTSSNPTPLTFAFRTRPRCTPPSIRASCWKPNTPIGRPATGDASSAGPLSAPSPQAPRNKKP